MKVSRNLISLLIINIVLFLVVFGLIEGIFRIVGIPYKVGFIPDESSFARFDPELGWSYIPNKSAINSTGNLSIPVYLDENGIRVPHQNFKFDYSKPSILFIGCSFTMGHGLTYEQSFVGKFDSLKNAPYQVVNLGVQGYGSDQALLALKRYLTKFNTKVVVYTFIEDHILRNGSHDRRLLVPTARFLGTKPQFALNDKNELYLARTPELYKNYIDSFLLDFINMRVGKMLGSFPSHPEKLTKSIIQEMKRYSNDHGAQFVVINWRWTRYDYDKLFRDLDVDVIDTMEGAPANWNTMRLNEGIHPNEKASDHAAMLLLAYLKRQRSFLPVNRRKETSEEAVK